MKVILLQDVAKMGRRFDVVDAPDGYALNKLIPQGMAEAATVANLKRVEARAQKASADRATEDAAFAAAVETLSGTALTLTMEANEQGHLFQAVKEAAIVAAAAKEGAVLTEAQVHLKAPIKTVGTHEVELHSGEARGTLTLNVEAK